MQDREDGVDEADFFVGDEGEDERDEEGDVGELVTSGGGQVRGFVVFILFKSLVYPHDCEGEVCREEERVSLGEVVVPVVASVEHCQRLSDVKVEELERWKRPLIVEQAIHGERNGQDG